MLAPVDLTRGGYQGDEVEEEFKFFTSQKLSYWWHFREVLRSSDTRSDRWSRRDGTSLSDVEQREFLMLSLLNHAVYTSFAEAIVSGRHLAVQAADSSPTIFHIRRHWKAAYSSLYTSFVPLCNLVAFLATSETPYTASGKVNNLSWGQTKDALTKASPPLGIFIDPLTRVHKRLELRSHLDHYWLIWLVCRPDGVFMDRDFEKGHLPLDRPTEYGDNVVERLMEDIELTAADYDLVYQQLAVSEGTFDRFLERRGWRVRYEDYGTPHNGSRPAP
jgi:hypothetical protein